MVEFVALRSTWLGGVIWLLWERRWRFLGVLFIVFFVAMEVRHAKDYYLFPIYPMVFAGGAVASGQWTSKRAWSSARFRSVCFLRWLL